MDRIAREAQLNPELLQISRRLTGLSMKRPGLAFGVHGEPGIGKTYATRTLLRGVPYQSISVHATLPLENIIQRIPRPKKIALWLEKILERIGKNQTLEIGMLNQALVTLLAVNAPIILHVEDLHEASEERLEFFNQFALGVTRTRGVGLIATSRVQPPNNFEAIKLQPLIRTESDALLEAEASAKLPPEALAWLFERAAGNPLFTLEFFRLLARLGSLWNDGHRWRFRTPEHETMPVTVEALIEQMLREATNTPALENAIGVKAMLGLGATEQLWAELAGLILEDLISLKQELEHRGVLVSGEFAHPLFREVVLAQMTRANRQGFARKALEVLKDDPRVAAEFIEDAGLEDAQALGWFEEAAQAAEGVGDKGQAGRFKAKAVEYATGEEKYRLALEAAQALRLFDLGESSRLVDIALEFQLKNRDAILLRANLLAVQGFMPESLATLEHLPESEKVGERWWVQQINLFSLNGDNLAVLKICQDHPELLETVDPDLCYKIGSTLAARGENTQAWILAQRGLAQSELLLAQRASLTVLCASVLVDQGDYLGAEKYYSEALALVQQTGRLANIAVVYYNRTIALRQLGLYRQMLSDLLEIVRLCAELGNGQRYAHARAILAEVYIAFAQYEQAEEILLESRNTLERTGVTALLVECESLLSYLFLMRRSVHGEVIGLKYADAALEHARSLRNPVLLLNTLFFAFQAQISNGNVSKAQELTAEMFTLLETTNNFYYQSNAYSALAKVHEALSEPDEALAALHQATKLTSSPLSLQTALLEIDRLTNNLDGARVRLAWFEERGLKNSVNIALRYFPELSTNSNQTPSTSNAESVPHLEALGSMRIKLEAQTTPVRGRKRQELLALLLEARISGRGEVPKLELVEKLYPDADELQANASLHDLIYNLRSSLGEGAISTTASGYALGNLSSDVEEFLKNAATKLWRGRYLEGSLLETSDTVRESLYLALRNRAKALLETDPLEATRVSRILCEADPYDLEAVRLTVLGLRSQQNHRSLSRVYDQARTRFLEIGEVLPARWQDFLTPIGTNA